MNRLIQISGDYPIPIETLKQLLATTTDQEANRVIDDHNRNKGKNVPYQVTAADNMQHQQKQQQANNHPADRQKSKTCTIL